MTTETEQATKTSSPHAPFRLMVSFAGGKYDLRIQAHETNADMLVVKSKNPEALDNLILATGVDPGVIDRFVGSAYHICFLDKKQASALVAAVVLGLVTKKEAMIHYVTEQIAEEDDDYGDAEEV